MSRNPEQLIVRGGTVVDARWSGDADVVVADGRVQALIEPGTGNANGAVEIDATGMLVLPGGVDPHCHVGFTSGAFTSLDDYESCTRAAVCGGTTTIIDFAIPRAGETPMDVAQRQGAKASQGWCDSALHGCVVEWDSTTPQQLVAMTKAGVRTVKMFTTYRGETMADDDTILRVMSALRPLGGMVVVHCEANHIVEHAQQQQADAGRIAASHMADTRPELAETAAVAAILAIAEALDAPVYFVHQSTADGVDLISSARRRGVMAFSEAVTHHLILDDGRYASAEPERYVCCPPLRPRAQVTALQQQVWTGEISAIGSDHCCYDLQQKRSHRDDVRAMPNGLPGVETRLPLIFSEFVVNQGLPVTRFVELTAANPARLNGIYPRKGSLLPGADADISIWDPSAPWTMTSADLHMATDFTPYEGRPMIGRPVTVIVRGQVVVHDDILIGDRPRGRFVPAAPLDELTAL